MESLKRRHSSDDEDANVEAKKTCGDYKTNVYNPNLDLIKQLKNEIKALHQK